jgi:hypothetical protein
MFLASRRAFVAARVPGMKRVAAPCVAVRNNSSGTEIQVDLGDAYATHSKIMF